MREVESRTERSVEKPGPLQLGIVAHAYLEIALTLGGGVAAEWLAQVPQMERELSGLPDFLAWAREHVLTDRPGRCETWGGMLLPHGEVSARVDWVDTESDPAVVIDWKHGNGQKFFLPPIDEDLQMLVYGAGFCSYLQRDVVVRRVLVSEKTYDEVHIDLDLCEKLERWFDGILKKVWRQSETRNVGPWCQKCWGRQHCQQRLDTLRDNQDALVLGRPGEISLSAGEAIRWARKRDVFRERAEQLDAALLRHVEMEGPIKWEGRELVAKSYTVDRVADHAKLLPELTIAAGVNAGYALRTNKGAVIDALKKNGLTKQQREEWLKRWREEGLLTTTRQGKLLWRKERE